MNEKQILFSGEMVRAILDGRKTQTRRVIKPQTEHGITMCHWSDSGWAIADAPNEFGNQACTCKRVSAPYGNAGDLLWVREAHNIQQIEHGWRVGYYADDSVIEYKMGYMRWHDVAYSLNNYAMGTKRPSIHMPRWASRITLRVTAVRAERVQEIEPRDCVSEGIYNAGSLASNTMYREAFASLWDSINAKRGYSWDSNPWVWVVEFERVTE